MKNNDTVTLTFDLLHSAGSYGGHGFNRKQLSLLGVEWPPKKGWLSNQVGRKIPGHVWASIAALKGETREEKKLRRRSGQPELFNETQST